MKKKITDFAEKNWWIIIFFAGTLVYSLSMILSHGQSVWFDEGYSILLAKQNFAELFSLTAVDAHPPFYYMLLKIWGMIFGFSEFSLRSLSAIFAAGAIMSVMLLTKKLFGLRIAMLSLPFVILAPFVIRYAYEIRMYSLAMLIGAAGTYALVVARETKRRFWWAIYAMFVTLGMLTLYMTAVIWLSHVIWQAILSIRHKLPITSWKWLWAYVVAVALFIPYLPTFVQQLTNSVLPGVGSAVTLTTLVDLATVFTLFTPQWDMGGWLSVFMLAMIISLVVIGTKVFSKKLDRIKAREGLLLYVCLAVVPISFFVLTSLPPNDPIFVNRYMAHVAIWVYLLVGVLISLSWQFTATSKFVKFAAALTVVLLGVGMFNLMERGNFIFERMQTPMTQQIRSDLASDSFANCGTNTTVVADDPYTYIDNVYYFEDCTFKFYSADQIERKGGYAPLHNSQNRIISSTSISTQYLVHLHWNQPKFEVDNRYELVKQVQYDKQWVDIYQFNEE